MKALTADLYSSGCTRRCCRSGGGERSWVEKRWMATACRGNVVAVWQTTGVVRNRAGLKHHLLYRWTPAHARMETPINCYAAQLRTPEKKGGQCPAKAARYGRGHSRATRGVSSVSRAPLARGSSQMHLLLIPSKG